MTLKTLKLETLKLEKSEMLDFAQFIIETLRKKEEEKKEFQLSDSQKSEIERRLKDIKTNLSAFMSGMKGEQQLVAKYGLEV